MKRPIGVIVLALAVLSTTAADPTMEELRSRFRRGVIAIASDEGVSFDEVPRRLEELAEATFEKHADVLRREAQRLIDDLPEFGAGSLKEYTEVHDVIEHPLRNEPAGGMLFVVGWNPHLMAVSVMNLVLSRKLASADFGKRTLLSQFCPDKVYRLRGTQPQQLVVQSLSDLFIVEVAFTDAGVLDIVSVKWLKMRPHNKRQIL